jgi:hypothetical protein
MKELRVYLIEFKAGEDSTILSKLANEQFIQRSENEGTVYSVVAFEDAFNYDNFNYHNSVIRFIEVETHDPICTHRSHNRVTTHRGSHCGDCGKRL